MSTPVEKDWALEEVNRQISEEIEKHVAGILNISVEELRKQTNKL